MYLSNKILKKKKNFSLTKKVAKIDSNELSLSIFCKDSFCINDDDLCWLKNITMEIVSKH